MKTVQEVDVCVVGNYIEIRPVGGGRELAAVARDLFANHVACTVEIQ